MTALTSSVEQVDYAAFLASKRLSIVPSGFDADPASLPGLLFEFQKDICLWALRLGKAAVFCATGLGKTAMQLAIAREVCYRTGRDALILAPLAVARQTAREADKFAVEVTLCREQADVRPGVNITNYERLHLFNPAHFVCIILDESSILKSYDSSTRERIIESFARTPYRFAFTATPAPNDHMELGNHAEFLGVMSRVEMLSMFFVHDGGETQKWRLKGHAASEFWAWVCSWAVMLRTPSDLGYDAGGFALPPLTMHRHMIEDWTPTEGRLFAVEALTLSDRRKARKASMSQRIDWLVSVVNRSHGIGNAEEEELSWFGSQNTQHGDGQNTNQTSKSDHEDDHNHAHQKPTVSTCANTTQPTLIATANTAVPPKSSDTDSPSKSSSRSSRRKKAAVPSADASQAHDDDSTLTTITLPGQSGDFSAIPATSFLGDTKTTPNNSAPTVTMPLRDTSAQRPEPWIIWVELNAEQDAIAARFGDRAFSVYGSLSPEEKTERLMAWLDGERPILISKPSILGFGINMQHCARVAFVGLSDSWEMYYQAIRRCWRFGQTREVECHVFVSTAEGAVLANIERKEQEARTMAEEMVKHLSVAGLQDAVSSDRAIDEYEPAQAMVLPSWVRGAA